MKLSKTKKVIATAAAFAFVGAGLVGCSTNSQGNETGKADEKKADSAYVMGETVVGKSGMALVVNSVEGTKETGNEYLKIEEGKINVIVDVTLTNTSDKALSYNPMYFSIKSATGVEAKQALVLLDDTLSFGELEPGDIVRGKVAFTWNEGESIKSLTMRNSGLQTDLTIKF